MIDETPALDRGIEGSDVDLVQCLVVDDGAGAIRVVADEVLEFAPSHAAMNAFDLGDTNLAGEEWVLAKRVVSTAKFEVAVDVDEGLEGNVNASARSSAADDDAIVSASFTLKVAATPMVAVSA